jgi:hypothetical protein
MTTKKARSHQADILFAALLEHMCDVMAGPQTAHSQRLFRGKGRVFIGS